MAPRTEGHRAVPSNLALALIASSSAPQLLLDKNLCIVAASLSFCSHFGIELKETLARRLSGLSGGEWNVPQLLSLLAAIAAGSVAADKYEMDLVRPDQTSRRLVITAKKLRYGKKKSQPRLVVTVVDVTDARVAENLRKKLLQEKEVLLQELHHRAANSLQIIASVLLQSARKVQSEETRTHLHDAHQRVMSVAALQKQLTISQLGDVKLGSYFGALCESIAAAMIQDRDKVSLTVIADDSTATADASVCMGLIVTELVINALKYAFPDDRRGKIIVYYLADGPHWKLSVADDGVGMLLDSRIAKAGLGTGIVQALALQLDANVNISGANPGTRVWVAHTHVPALTSSLDVRVG